MGKEWASVRHLLLFLEKWNLLQVATLVSRAPLAPIPLRPGERDLSTYDFRILASSTLTHSTNASTPRLECTRLGQPGRGARICQESARVHPGSALDLSQKAHYAVLGTRPWPGGLENLYLIRLLKGHFLHSVQHSRPRVVVGTSMSNSRHSQLRSISVTFDLQVQVAGGWRAPWSSS